MPFASHGDVRIRYEVEGEGEPLVLIDGFSTGLEMWREQGYTRALAGACQLILVDPRGHGQSDKPHDPGQYRPELMAGDVAVVLDRLGLEKAHYLGASMGAAIGFEVVRRAPERLRSLILMGYGRHGQPTEAQRQFQATGLRLEEMAVAMGPEAALAALERLAGPRPPEERARFLANDHQALLAFLKANAEWPSFEEILPAVTVPTLFLVAEGDPFYESARQCAARMPAATLVSLAGGFHGQASYDPERVVPHIRVFLRQASGA